MNTARTARMLVARRGPRRALHVSTQRYNSLREGPPPTNVHGVPEKKSGSNNVPLFLGLGLAALAGGGYYYYATAESERIDREKRKLEARAATPARIAEEAKIRAQEAAQDVHGAAGAKWTQTKEATNKTIDEGWEKVQAVKADAQHKADEAKQAVQTKATEAKKSWWSWFSWGKDQVTKTTEDLKKRANETEEQWARRWEEAKAKAKAKGEEIAQRAGETEEEYRIRIARAISRKD